MNSTLATSKTITLEQAWSLYSAKHTLRQITHDYYDYALHKYLSDWLSRDLNSITRLEVLDRHKELTETNGKGVGNVALKVFRAVFNYARAVCEDEQGERLLKNNPAEVMKEIRGWNKLKPRTRHIGWSQYRSWYLAVQKIKHRTMRDLFMFCALTGCRKKEALDLKWADVSFQERWVLFRQTKNGGDHKLPVCQAVIDLLYARQALSKGGEYVMFPPRQPFRQFTFRSHTLQTLRDNGIETCLHDMRRSYATLASHMRVDMLVIRRLLNHCSTSVTEHYIQRNCDPFRAEVDAIGGVMWRLMTEEVSTVTMN